MAEQVKSNIMVVIELILLSYLLPILASGQDDARFDICAESRLTGPQSLDYSERDKRYFAYYNDFYIEVHFDHDIHSSLSDKIIPYDKPRNSTWNVTNGIFPPVSAVYTSDPYSGSYYFRNSWFCGNTNGTEGCDDFNSYLLYANETVGVTVAVIQASAQYTPNDLILLGSGTRSCSNSKPDCNPVVNLHAFYFLQQPTGKKQKLTLTAYDSAHHMPSNLALRQDTNRVAFVVTYGPVWTVTEASGEKPFPVPKDKPIYSSAIWLGCPMELCIESNFDAAGSDSQGNIQLYRDRYRWTFAVNNEAEPVTPSLFKYGVFVRSIDAISNLDENTRVVFKDEHYYLIDKEGTALSDVGTIEDLFHLSESMTDHRHDHIHHVDAATRTDGNLALFADHKYVEYKTTLTNNDGKWTLGTEFVNYEEIHYRWPEAVFVYETNVDAAVRHGDRLLMFSNGYLFKAVNSKGGDVSVALTPQGELYKCTDDAIKMLVGNLLGYTTFDEYRAHLMRFAPPSKEVKIPSGDQETSKKMDSRLIGLIVMSLITGLLLIIAVILITINVKSGRGAFKSSSSRRSSSRRSRN